MHQITKLGGQHDIVSVKNDIRNRPHEPETLGDVLKQAILREKMIFSPLPLL